MKDGDDEDPAVVLHWARVRLDAAIHELHLAQRLVRKTRDFQAAQLAHIAEQIRHVRHRLR